MRAGNLATPAKAMPSSSTSSSGSTWPLPCIRVRNSSWIAIASSTGLPITRSVITDAEACEIEQPSASYETSSTTTGPVGDVHAQRHLVTAGRVDVVHLGLERLPQPLVVGVAVVVQDDLLVEGIELGAHSGSPRKGERSEAFRAMKDMTFNST